MTNKPTLSDIVKGTPSGNEAVEKALVASAREQEEMRKMAEGAKQFVAPTFSDIVDMVRNNYEVNFGIDVGYIKAAKAVDEAIKPQVREQVLRALEKIKAAHNSGLNHMASFEAVGRVIEEIEREYRNE